MSNPSKRKGSKWETDTRDYDIEQGFDVTRLSPNGAKDIGDKVIRVPARAVTPVHYVFECKAERALDLAGWVTEAAIEADNYATLNRLDPNIVIPVVLAKRRMAGVGRAYVIQEYDWWLHDHR